MVNGTLEFQSTCVSPNTISVDFSCAFCGFAISVIAAATFLVQHFKMPTSGARGDHWQAKKCSHRSTQSLSLSLFHCTSYPGGWFQPIWKTFVKMGIFPKIGAKIKLYLKTTTQYLISSPLESCWKKTTVPFFPKGREKLLKIVGKGVIPAGIGILMAWVCKNPCFFPLIFPSLPLENHVWSLKVSASTTTTTLSFLRRRCLFVSKGGGSEVQSGGLNIWRFTLW